MSPAFFYLVYTKTIFDRKDDLASLTKTNIKTSQLCKSNLHSNCKSELDLNKISNPISIIPIGAFAGLLNLKTLNLGDNIMSSIPQNAFDIGVCNRLLEIKNNPASNGTSKGLITKITDESKICN